VVYLSLSIQNSHSVIVILSIEEYIETCAVEVVKIELKGHLAEEWAFGEEIGVKCQDFDVEFVLVEFWIEEEYDGRSERRPDFFEFEEIYEVLDYYHAQLVNLCTGDIHSQCRLLTIYLSLELKHLL
jgi:hypothetical protein